MTGPDRAQLVVRGEHAGLGPLRRDLIEDYARWSNDPIVRRGRGLREVRTLDDQARWYDEASAGWPARVCFTVYELAGSRAIGISELRGISSEYGCATLAISLGERRGQGLGSEAVRLTLEWAFQVLGLHNVMLEVREWNEVAIRAYRKAGFEVIGKRRGSSFSDGRRIDEVLMDAIAPDFSSDDIPDSRSRPDLGRR